MTHIELIEKEAELFFSGLTHNSRAVNIEFFDQEIGTRLYSISKEQYKIVFLTKLRKSVIQLLDKHRENCSKGKDCYEEERWGYALFAIDQHIDNSKDSYEYEPDDPGDVFSAEDIANLDTKMDHIITVLMAQGDVQEDILEQLRDLKTLFNLGKKGWFRIVTGTLVDWVGSGIVGTFVVETVAKEIGIIENLQKAIELMGKY